MEINSVVITVGIFLCICLFSGLWAGRGTKTFEQYAVGDKNFSVATLVATVVATHFGGGYLFRNLEQIYTHGFYFVIAMVIGNPLGYFFTSRFISIRMGEFMTHLSIAESMGALFGRYVRFITAISGILCSIGGVAIQINVISRIIKLCCGIEGHTPIYVAISIVIVYSTFGGIKAVTFTDVIQFVTFTTLIPLLIYLVSIRIIDDKSIVTILTTHPNFDLRQVFACHHKLTSALSLMFVVCLPEFNNPVIQRIYMSKDVWDVRSVFTYTALMSLIIQGMVICLAIALFAYDANLDPKSLVEHILKMYNHGWLQSFVCIAILALAMSTADSLLHTSSVLFTHDIATVFNWNPKNKLRIAHLSSIVIAFLALRFAFYEPDLLNIIIYLFNFSKPIVTIPFLMALFGFRPSSKSVLIGMAAGACTVIAFKNGIGKYLHIQYETFPAMLMNFIFLMGSYYLLPKVPGTGWVGIKDITPLLVEKQNKVFGKAERKEFWQNFSLTNYLKPLVPQRKIVYLIVGLYCLIVQAVQLKDGIANPFIATGLLILANFLALYVVLQGHITQKYQQWFVYLYPWIMFTLLFVASSYMMPLYDYNKFSTRIFLVNIFVALCLLPGEMVSGMIIFTVLLMYHCPVIKNDDFSLLTSLFKSKNCCMLPFFISLYALVIYWKKEIKKHLLKLSYVDQDKTNSQANQITKLQYHYQTSRLTYENGSKDKILPEISSDIERVIQDPRLPTDLKEKLYGSIDRLHGYGQFIEESRYIREFHLCLDPQPIDISSFFRNVAKKLAALDAPVSIILHNQSKMTHLCADPIRMEQLLVHWVYYILAENKNTDNQTKILHLYILDTAIEYSLNQEGFTKTLPALAFVLTPTLAQPAIETLYKDSLDELSYVAPKDIHELYKHVIFRIVTAHYGCCHFMKEGSIPKKGAVPPQEDYCIPKKGAVPPHNYCIPQKGAVSLPVDLKEIRDDVMNKVPEQPYYPIAETAASLAQEKALEEVLVKETMLTSPIIQEAIQFIKLCHGDQVRASGEPYYTHPMAVAQLLLEETNDPYAILAALLHDVVEDSKVSITYIQSKYGQRIADIVATVTHMGDSFRKKKLSKSESEAHLRQFKDLAAVQVKIADRLHNVLTLRHRPREKQIKVAQQTLDFYLPFAESVGVVKLTKRLRNLCEEILESK